MTLGMASTPHSPVLIGLCVLLLNSMVQQTNSVHGRHYMRRTAQQRQMDADTEVEEELDSEAEDQALVDRIISLSAAVRDDISSKATTISGGDSTIGIDNVVVDPLNSQQGHQPQQQLQQQQHQFQTKDNFFEQGETRDFLHFLRRIKYDHRQCPQNGGKAVLISVSVVVSNVRAVSEVTMDYSLEMFYRESWLDERLRYDVRQFRNKTELALHESYANFLWHPDTFMPNAIASKNPRKQSISHRSLLRLQSDGQILYSRRLSVVAECPMDLTLFPFDSQTCKLGIESYGYTSDQVIYGWSRGQRAALKLHKIRLPDFRIKEAFVTTQMESYATGNYSRLYVCFVFSRSAGFCFLQLIIPSTAVVITSWVSLWMENETSFQDMISIILTITFLLFSYNEVMPRVSYLKALDIWLAVCFMIVFLSLIKLAIMKYMRQRLRVEPDTGTNDHGLLAGMLPVMQLSSMTARQMGNGLLPGGYGDYGPTAMPAPPPSSKRASTTTHGNIRPLTPPPLMRSTPPNSAQQLRQSTRGDGQQQQQQPPQCTQRRAQHRLVSRQRSPSAGSSAEEEKTRRRRSTTTVSSGLEAILGGTVSQLLAHQAAVANAAANAGAGGGGIGAGGGGGIGAGRRKASGGSNFSGGGGGGGGGQIAPYQPPISTLAATALNLPLSQSSLRQLQQQKLYQAQQQLQFQMQMQQSQLLHQAQLQVLKEQRRRERKLQKAKERRHRQQELLAAGRTRLDRNQNELASRRSPITSIRIGIESSSSSAEDTDSGTSVPEAREKRLFFCFDQFGNVEFSPQFMRRFHWLSQMSFFFGFVLFCLYFFLVYPNSRMTAMDPACSREEAEWFASIPI